jgi:2,4-dienoyl-CoA reductase-like NADH-dependent reductase (Old Yellow Enzyme family)
MSMMRDVTADAGNRPAAEIAPLFKPLSLRSLTVSNRFVMSPMTRSFSPGGIPGADVAAYYRRRAEGDVGLIITEGVGVPHGAALGDSGVDGASIPVMEGPEALAGWKHVVDEVHAAGGRIAPQLWHQGAMRAPGTGPFPHAASIRPSGLWGPLDRLGSVPPDFIARVAEPTAPASDEEIADVIAAFARGAANARAIGFDAIAIHAAHGYLIDTFLWTETNRREDRWGGDMVRRSAFAAALVREVRTAVGEELPIIFRFSQWKQQDFKARIAHTPQELEVVLGPIADAGVDVFDASQRYFDRAEFEGSTMNLAGWARKVTGKRSMAVGGVGLGGGTYDAQRDGRSGASNNLTRVAARFANAEFDLIAVGRALLGDAGWVQRARAGHSFLVYDDKMRETLI